MPCALCLKDTIGKNRRIDFASSKAEELDIKTIIDLHFWRQIKNDPESSEFICKPCWDCLFTFHQFYLTIENAHSLMESEAVEAELNVKEESEPSMNFINRTGIDDAQPAKRKRGYLRCQPLPVSIDVLFPLSGNIDKENRALSTDEIKLNDIKVELPEADVAVTDVLDENISLEQLVETAYSEDSEDNSKETRHLSQRKLRRINKKSIPNNNTTKTDTKGNSKATPCLSQRKSNRTSKKSVANKRKETVQTISRKNPLICDICDSSITDMSEFMPHNKMMHNDDMYKKRTCTICSKISSDLYLLQSHIKYTHNTERKHKCAECDKAFKFPIGLREHMAIHTGERLYKCPHCPTTFNSNANMHSHRKKKHRAEWEANRRQWVYVGDGELFLDLTESENSD